MIARLRGRPVALDADGLVLDVSGVGYRLLATPSAVRKADGADEVAARDAPARARGRAPALRLRERRRAGALRAAPRRHRRRARRSRSRSSPATRRPSCGARSCARTRRLFQAIPGIGKKTAQRVVLELREKVAPLAAVEAPHLGAGDGHIVARDALVELGYTVAEAEQRLADDDPDLPPAERVRAGAEGGMSERRGNHSSRRLRRRTTSSRARCARAGSTSSSGRSASRSSSRSRSRRRRGGGRRSTTSSSSGPPGLGKTSLAYIIREELGVGIRTVAGPALERKGDMAAILTSLEERDVLFVDEIHRLDRAVEEILYPALEDFRLDIIVGQGPAARTLTLDLPPFTLVGATTRTGLLTTPLRDRFGMTYRLDYYEPDELATIVRRSARILGVEIEAEAADEIARRAARHAARREPDPAPRARRRRGAPRRRRHARRSRARRSTLLEVDGDGPRAHRPRAARGDRRTSSAAARSASRRSPSRSARSRHDRGRLRAVPAPARADPAHAARAHRHRARPGACGRCAR